MDGKAAGHAERLAGSQSSHYSDVSLHRQRLIFLGLFFWQFNFFSSFVFIIIFFLESIKKKSAAVKKNPFPLEAGRGFIDR